MLRFTIFVAAAFCVVSRDGEIVVGDPLFDDRVVVVVPEVVVTAEVVIELITPSRLSPVPVAPLVFAARVIMDLFNKQANTTK